MIFTLEQVRYLMKNWHFIQIHLRRYATERADILHRAGGSVVAPGGRSSEPSNPTLSKAQQLAALDERYGRFLTFARCVDDVMKALGKRAKPFKLHFVDGLTTRKTAAKLKMAPSTAHRRIEEVLDILVHYLSQSATGGAR